MMVLTLAKPRVRRLITTSGFFHAAQKQNGKFLLTLARMGIPADELALEHALERMAAYRRSGRPYFLFMNLYDVHAPYSPSRTSPLRSFGSPRDILENLSLTCVLPKVSNHSYLRPGFHLSEHNRSMLLARYHAAIELMDAKLESFYESARRTGLLDDTLLVITSDHGEAFGEHGLYLHDASVYETHLHVPLWIHHPGRAAEVVDDVVTTRHLFGLLEAAVLNRRLNETVLDPGYRRDNLAALAEHFHYPRIEGLLERYRHNQAAAIVADRKIVRRGDVLEVYDLLQDPHELNPKPAVCAQAAKLLSHDHGDLAVVHRAAEHVCRGSVARRAA